MKKKNDLISLFLIPIVSFAITLLAFTVAMPHHNSSPVISQNNDKASVVERAFDTYFEKEMGCTIEEFTHGLAQIE